MTSGQTSLLLASQDLWRFDFAFNIQCRMLAYESSPSGVLQLGCTLPLWGAASALAHVHVVDVQVCGSKRFTSHPSRVTSHLAPRLTRCMYQPPDAILLCDSTELHIIPKPPPPPIPSTELSNSDDATPAPPTVQVTICSRASVTIYHCCNKLNPAACHNGCLP
jgi:hypothetical protein